uniref:hypothetical protein n=1 Tax=Acidisphaera sp. L21 TaxID=1641851 RepID=UPI00131A919A
VFNRRTGSVFQRWRHRRSPPRVITGRVLGAMHDRGAVLHYRVSVGGSLCYLAPPSWLHPDSRVAVAQAGLELPPEIAEGMWVSRINRLAEVGRDKPEGVA